MAADPTTPIPPLAFARAALEIATFWPDGGLVVMEGAVRDDAGLAPALALLRAGDAAAARGWLGEVGRDG